MTEFNALWLWRGDTRRRPWDGTWSLSPRFYTPLFPVVAIGVAALADDRRRTTRVVASLCVGWTVALVLTLQTLGPPHGDYYNISGGATDVAAELGSTTPGAAAWGLAHLSNLHALAGR